MGSAISDKIDGMIGARLDRPLMFYLSPREMEVAVLDLICAWAKAREVELNSTVELASKVLPIYKRRTGATGAVVKTFSDAKGREEFSYVGSEMLEILLELKSHIPALTLLAELGESPADPVTDSGQST